jgi:hypothetical protein
MMKNKSSPEDQLQSFIEKFTPGIASITIEILGRMRKRYPSALELVYDNYNALAIGFGPTERTSEAIFSIAVFPRWVSLFFLQAKGLHDPEQRLRGTGKVVKHIVLSTPAILDDPYVEALMRDAVSKAVTPFSADTKHRLIIKSISAKQRPRRPATKTASK